MVTTAEKARRRALETSELQRRDAEADKHNRPTDDLYVLRLRAAMRFNHDYWEARVARREKREKETDAYIFAEKCRQEYEDDYQMFLAGFTYARNYVALTPEDAWNEFCSE